MKLVQGGSVTVVEAARAVLASRGVGGFFAGNTIDVLRTVPSKALELAAFDSYKRTLRATPWVPDRAIGAVAGGLAGITSTVAIYPLETVRTRMAVNGHTFVQTLQRVGSHGGLPGLYRVSRQGEDEGGSEGTRGGGGASWHAQECIGARNPAPHLRRCRPPWASMRMRAEADAGVPTACPLPHRRSHCRVWMRV